MKQTGTIKWVRLGDYITQRREKNDSYGLPIRGVTRDGFIPPKQEGADTSLYNVFYRNDFVFNPARMELNSIYLNLEFDKAICSSLYEIFFVNKPDVLLPEYLNLIIKREEFARYCWYDALGSARNYFRVANMQDLTIPLPPIEVQQELVDTYNGLKSLAEQNEALIEPLSKACEAFIVDCQTKYPKVKLSDGKVDFIELCDERNGDGLYTLDDVRGISIQKNLIPTKADMKDVSLAPYKQIKPREFSYVTVTSRNGGKISLAMNNTDCTYIVSSSYITFRCKDTTKLMPEYLYLLLSRTEFDRYSRFNSWGSARETFDWSEMCRVEIPLPPIEVQQSIINVYHCLKEAKSIAAQAREKLKTLFPALVQKASNI